MKEKTKKWSKNGETRCRLMCAGGNRENRKRCRTRIGESHKGIVVVIPHTREEHGVV